jgi:hypothetical protein
MHWEERKQVVYRLTGTMPPDQPGRWRRDRYMGDQAKDDAMPPTPHAFAGALLENTGTNEARVQTTSVPILLRNPIDKLRDDMQETAKIVALAEPVRDALNVLSNPELVKAAAQRHPKALDGLRSLVVGTYAPNPTTKGGRAARFFGQNLAVSALALNPLSVAANLVGVVRMFPEMKAAHLAGAVKDLKDGRSLFKDLKERSGYFHMRYGTSAHARISMVGTASREVPAVRSASRAILAAARNAKAGDLAASFSNVREATGASLELYNLADAPLSILAYAAKIRESKEKNGSAWTEDQHRDWAARQAEQTVADTQPGHSALDAALFAVESRGTGLSAFTLFTSDVVRARNRIVLAFHESRARGVKVLASETANIVTGRVARKLLGAALGVAAMTLIGGDDEDREKVLKDAMSPGAFAGDVGGDVLSLLLPIPGSQLNSVLRGFGGDSAASAPAQESVSSAVDAAVDAVSKTADAIERHLDDRPQRIERLLQAWAKAGNEAASATVGNPLAPWIRMALRAWKQAE